MSRPRKYETDAERDAARKKAQTRYNKTMLKRTVCLQTRVSPALARKVDDSATADGLTRADWLRRELARLLK